MRKRGGGQVAWNNALVEERRRLGLETVNLDWATATYLFHQGMSAEEAAKRVRVPSTVARDNGGRPSDVTQVSREVYDHSGLCLYTPASGEVLVQPAFLPQNPEMNNDCIT